jgi:EH domain-containing protein 1
MSVTELYDKWFQFSDSDNDGKVTGKDAVSFFERSGLPRETLAKIWELSNSNRQGYLDRGSFHRAMDMISMAQSGNEVSRENYMAQAQNGFLCPRMEGFDEEGVPETVSINPVTGAFINAPTSFGSSRNAAPAQQEVIEFEKQQQMFGLRKAREIAVKKVIPGKVCVSVVDGLKQSYFTKIRPLEDAYKFGIFFSPLLMEGDFEAKPNVMLLGQYSTGKTTFIKHLLKRSYPGANIGPEPTTDKFVVVFGGIEDRRIPGQTLAVQPDKPYQGVSHFGTGFLARFEGAQTSNAPLLEEITLVDTPGVLSGQKQLVDRAYNFTSVTEWFATRSDLILLLFDPHKLDISDEFRAVIAALRGHDDKIRIVLNKADQMEQRELMRCYGALMWSLGKVMLSPEVCKVYCGSFNSEAPIRTDKNPNGLEFFESEEKQLLDDLYEVPGRSADRRINEFVKRVRAFRIHLLIIGHLRKQMPSMFGGGKAQKKLMEDLKDHFGQVQREYQIPAGDFPNVDRYRETLSAFDISKFPNVTKEMVKKVDEVLTIDIPALVRQFDNPF